MAVNNFRKPSIFSGGKSVINVPSFLIVNADKWGGK